MEEHDKKNQIVKTMMNMEYYPTVLEEEVSIAKYTKLPLTKISAMGTAFEPLTAAFQNVMHGGGTNSGLYRVTIPKGAHLAEFKDGSGFLGSALKGNNAVGGGQARLNPLVCNPTTLFMAAALMGIDKKLDSIQETQQEIIEFLEQKEKSKLRGNLNFLTDVLNNYKYNWNNEKYKNSNHIKVLDNKQDAEQSIVFYREQINKKNNKKSFLHSDRDVKGKLEKIQSEFKEYQLALYLYSFSSFLEVMLLENFDSAYLDSVAQKIEEHSYQYRELYTKCYDRIEGDAKSSIQSHLLSGLASFNRVAGDAAAKVSAVSKTQIEETLIGTSNRLGDFGSRKTEKTMEQFANNRDNYVQPFIENIKAVNRLYNEPMELIFDQDNIYLSLSVS